jgi:hypothetical protein
MNEEYTPPWYTITNMVTIDTPALAIFPERVKQNIQLLNEYGSRHRMAAPARENP